MFKQVLNWYGFKKKKTECTGPMQNGHSLPIFFLESSYLTDFLSGLLVFDSGKMPLYIKQKAN